MKIKIFLSLFTLSFLFLTPSLYAQERKCAANDAMDRQIARDPSIAGRMIAIEKHTQNFVDLQKGSSNNKGKPPGGGGGGGGTPSFDPVTIPVVVHILWNTESQNISDARVTEQIKILNDDFGATNSDIDEYVPDKYSSAVSAGAGISFCLVQTIRKETDVTSFGTNDNMKYDSRGGSNSVDPAHYLNIWVCNMGGGILGYAYYPGINPEIDGVVILTSAFGITSGNYDLGRTATHEVGHYFNLHHIWGDRHCGNDLVDDTPLHDAANYGCPTQGSTSNCKGPVVEMWMNYMDYTYDRCMYMFTTKQAQRMQATLISGGPRYGMRQNNPCAGPPAKTNRNSVGISQDNSTRNYKAFQVYPTLTSGNVFMELYAGQTGIAELTVYNPAGMLITRKRISVVEGTNTQQVNLNGLSNGLYIVRIQEGNNKYLQKIIVQH
jgi:hypothetical protein